MKTKTVKWSDVKAGDGAPLYYPVIWSGYERPGKFRVHLQTSPTTETVIEVDPDSTVEVVVEDGE